MHEVPCDTQATTRVVLRLLFLRHDTLPPNTEGLLSVKAWITSFGSSAGSGFSAVWCLGAPAVTGMLSALGLGFVINDAILLPVMALFLGLNLWASRASSLRHGRKTSFYMAVVSALLLVSGLWVSGAVTAIGIAGIFTASGLDLYFSKHCTTDCLTRSNTPEKG